MTTYQHADWKITPLYRSLLRVAWVLFAAAAVWAVAGMTLGATAAYWVAASLAGGAVALSLLLPEPVPAAYLTESRNWFEERSDFS